MKTTVKSAWTMAEMRGLALRQSLLVDACEQARIAGGLPTCGLAERSAAWAAMARAFDLIDGDPVLKAEFRAAAKRRAAMAQPIEKAAEDSVDETEGAGEE